MLKFCNNYPVDVSVCIMWYHPGCPDGGDWEKMGWWNLSPGECNVVYANDLDDVNRYWYFYAEAADGAYWAGPNVTAVPYERFDWCVNTASTTSRDVGFRELDVGDNDGVTVNLSA